MLIDTHCHLDFAWFDTDRQQVVQRALEAGVETIVVPAIDIDSCRSVLNLAEEHDQVFAAVGVHPNSSAGWSDQWLAMLRDMALHDKVVAIGEIGLDYYRDRSPIDVQKRALAAQAALAAELGLPVIIHNRLADEDVLSVLAASPLSGVPVPGVFHSFSGTRETADRALSNGYYLGITGPITYKNADDLRLVVQGLPNERILVETDAPFLAPQQYRGKRNEPAFVKLVAEKLAAVRGVSFEEFTRQTSENAARLFGSQLIGGWAASKRVDG